MEVETRASGTDVVMLLTVSTVLSNTGLETQGVGTSVVGWVGGW